MFLCKECHKSEERDFGCTFDGHMSGSHGRCEGCGKVKDCVDCKSYKYKSRPAIVDPTTGMPQ